MNGVLIKPLSLGALENELMRYFESGKTSIYADGVYSFDAFSNLIKDDPHQIIVILEEIEKVHLETLMQLRMDSNQAPIDEAQFQRLVHKVKGGAQLLQAAEFIYVCESLEVDGLLSERIGRFITLLEEQNQIIESYRKKLQQ
jgi:two-component system sensor histidine kinase EvgS